MKIQLTPSELISQSSELSALQSEYESLFNNVSNTLNSVNNSWSANLANNFIGKISSAQKSFANMTALLSQGASAASQSAKTLESVDKLIAGAISGTGASAAASGGKGSQLSSGSVFWNELKANYGWNEALAGSNYVKEIYGISKSIESSSTLGDYAKTGVKTYEFLKGAARTSKNYKKIGNAVGAEKATTWWFKNITGLKPLGRASQASNVFQRFKNNLTNKTSPFNAQLKNVTDNFTGANGVGKAVASWGTVLVNGVLNYSSNKSEQAESGGTMTDGRVIAETITETAVDTVLSYGAGIVVGAAITAALGTVAAPGVVVTALGGLVVAGIDAAVKATTGVSTTEWISDTILDVGTTVVNKVGNAISNASKTVASWFGK